MTGTSYKTSAEMASEFGAFPGHNNNAEAMLRVIRNHRLAAIGETKKFEELSILTGQRFRDVSFDPPADVWQYLHDSSGKVGHAGLGKTH